MEAFINGTEEGITQESKRKESKPLRRRKDNKRNHKILLSVDV